MPASWSKVQVTGHLGQDPREHTFNDGSKVVNLSIATSDRWKDREGQQQERTHWVSVACFNVALGEVCTRYLRKGSYVYVEGTLESRDRDGKTENVVVMRPFNSELKMLDKAPDTEPSRSSANRRDRGSRAEPSGRR